jgi:hypothetical protein
MLLYVWVDVWDVDFKQETEWNKFCSYDNEDSLGLWNQVSFIRYYESHVAWRTFSGQRIP